MSIDHSNTTSSYRLLMRIFHPFVLQCHHICTAYPQSPNICGNSIRVRIRYGWGLSFLYECQSHPLEFSVLYQKWKKYFLSNIIYMKIQCKKYSDITSKSWNLKHPVRLEKYEWWSWAPTSDQEYLKMKDVCSLMRQLRILCWIKYPKMWHISSVMLICHWLLEIAKFISKLYNLLIDW